MPPPPAPLLLRQVPIRSSSSSGWTSGTSPDEGVGEPENDPRELGGLDSLDFALLVHAKVNLDPPPRPRKRKVYRALPLPTPPQPPALTQRNLPPPIATRMLDVLSPTNTDHNTPGSQTSQATAILKWTEVPLFVGSWPSGKRGGMFSTGLRCAFFRSLPSPEKRRFTYGNRGHLPYLQPQRISAGGNCGTIYFIGRRHGLATLPPPDIWNDGTVVYVERNISLTAREPRSTSLEAEGLEVIVQRQSGYRLLKPPRASTRPRRRSARLHENQIQEAALHVSGPTPCELCGRLPSDTVATETLAITESRHPLFPADTRRFKEVAVQTMDAHESESTDPPPRPIAKSISEQSFPAPPMPTWLTLDMMFSGLFPAPPINAVNQPAGNSEQAISNEMDSPVPLSPSRPFATPARRLSQLRMMTPSPPNPMPRRLPTRQLSQAEIQMLSIEAILRRQNSISESAGTPDLSTPRQAGALRPDTPDISQPTSIQASQHEKNQAQLSFFERLAADFNAQVAEINAQMAAIGLSSQYESSSLQREVAAQPEPSLQLEAVPTAPAVPVQDAKSLSVPEPVTKPGLFSPSEETKTLGAAPSSEASPNAEWSGSQSLILKEPAPFDVLATIHSVVPWLNPSPSPVSSSPDRITLENEFRLPDRGESLYGPSINHYEPNQPSINYPMRFSRLDREEGVIYVNERGDSLREFRPSGIYRVKVGQHDIILLPVDAEAESSRPFPKEKASGAKLLQSGSEADYSPNHDLGRGIDSFGRKSPDASKAGFYSSDPNSFLSPPAQNDEVFRGYFRNRVASPFSEDSESDFRHVVRPGSRVTFMDEPEVRLYTPQSEDMSYQPEFQEVQSPPTIRSLLQLQKNDSVDESQEEAFFPGRYLDDPNSPSTKRETPEFDDDDFIDFKPFWAADSMPAIQAAFSEEKENTPTTNSPVQDIMSPTYDYDARQANNSKLPGSSPTASPRMVAPRRSDSKNRPQHRWNASAREEPTYEFALPMDDSKGESPTVPKATEPKKSRRRERPPVSPKWDDFDYELSKSDSQVPEIVLTYDPNGTPTRLEWDSIDTWLDQVHAAAPGIIVTPPSDPSVSDSATGGELTPVEKEPLKTEPIRRNSRTASGDDVRPAILRETRVAPVRGASIRSKPGPPLPPPASTTPPPKPKVEPPPQQPDGQKWETIDLESLDGLESEPPSLNSTESKRSILDQKLEAIPLPPPTPVEAIDTPPVAEAVDSKKEVEASEKQVPKTSPQRRDTVEKSPDGLVEGIIDSFGALFFSGTEPSPISRSAPSPKPDSPVKVEPAEPLKPTPQELSSFLPNDYFSLPEGFVPRGSSAPTGGAPPTPPDSVGKGPPLPTGSTRWFPTPSQSTGETGPTPSTRRAVPPAVQSAWSSQDGSIFDEEDTGPLAPRPVAPPVIPVRRTTQTAALSSPAPPAPPVPPKRDKPPTPPRQQGLFDYLGSVFSFDEGDGEDDLYEQASVDSERVKKKREERSKGADMDVVVRRKEVGPPEVASRGAVGGMDYTVAYMRSGGLSGAAPRSSLKRR
ncbi:hypothetical protein DFJ73DRAFT_879586 [Zopfochytrium polystomum]|nr:hypothetical protein DFJ73DRAFT_879586 [Zopfochytrium polystomum]